MMTWSLRAIAINMAMGAALVGVQWVVGWLLVFVLPSSGWWATILVLYLLVGGYVLAKRYPRGFGGASAGVFLACVLPAHFVGGATAKTLAPAFAFMAAFLVGVGEFVGLALQLRALKREQRDAR
jgi:hypothetical protein